MKWAVRTRALQPGCSFSDHTGIAAYKPIVSIDDTPARVDRWESATLGLLGDAALTLDALLRRLRSTPEACLRERIHRRPSHRSDPAPPPHPSGARASVRSGSPSHSSFS
ncbi:hypothetical protein KO481_20535 [Nocardia sp. NEAU-G5]|uniref:Uncharacterized protein n=1 Tax=Nocardia albiluteola TaxID=2842303 RepID=A0ABS6B0S9_9NOCA|nr:hypothetical protein [Nocardia albiluteola]MBU3063906.1 hypothetical protein [Nocardia albiluteola]